MTASVGDEPIASLPSGGSDETSDLCARLRQGDEDAFTEFFERYCDRLFRYLLVLTRGQEELSRELLQITMRKVAVRPPGCADETHLWNWLAAIGRNAFIDHLRRSRRAPALVPLLPEEAAEFPALPWADEETPLLRALDQSLMDLTPEERGLIEAVYFRKGTHQSVADEQKTTAKAVESKLARVRAKMRATILKRLRYEKE